MKIEMNTNGLKLDTSDEKHLKGYIYDSLAYRYMIARKAMARLEWIEESKIKDFQICNDRAQRDILKFLQILDEAIGEHD